MLKNREIVSYFNENMGGSDYIVGDIHGQFHKLLATLEKMEFNFKKDRLFSCGDLCDRGSNSKMVIDILKESWFHPVMGNHDWFIIRSYYLKDDFSNRRWCSTIQGGGWWELLANDEKEEIAFLIGQIPNVIEINNPDNKIGVVHANVPEKMSWGEFTIKIKCSEELQKYSNWNRDRAHGKFKNKFIRGIGHVYFGHTVFDNPTTEGNCTFIDTGSGYECNMDEYYLSNGRLSILEI